MLYIFRSAKIGHHDIIHVFKTEHITSKFDTFPVMSRDTFDAEGFISDADSLTSSEDKYLVSVQDFTTFDDVHFFSLFSDDCRHLAVVKYHHITYFHDFDYFWEADLEFSWFAKTIFRFATFVGYFKSISYFHRYTPSASYCFMNTWFWSL